MQPFCVQSLIQKVPALFSLCHYSITKKIIVDCSSAFIGKSHNCIFPQQRKTLASHQPRLPHMWLAQPARRPSGSARPAHPKLVRAQKHLGQRRLPFKGNGHLPVHKHVPSPSNGDTSRSK
jgi:hypothetical protein